MLLAQGCQPRRCASSSSCARTAGSAGGMSASSPKIPIAVMVDHPTAELLQELRNREISRVIVKPFRAKVLLDTFASFG